MTSRSSTSTACRRSILAPGRIRRRSGDRRRQAPAAAPRRAYAGAPADGTTAAVDASGGGTGADGELQAPGAGGGHGVHPLGISESAAGPVGGAGDPRQGFDIAVLVLAGLGTLALVLVGVTRLARRRRAA